MYKIILGREKMEFVFKHIVRQPIKSLLLLVILAAFSLSSVLFARAITSAEQDIVLFHENTEIVAEIRLENPALTVGDPERGGPGMHNIISRSVVQLVRRTEFYQSLDFVYTAAGFLWTNIVRAGADGEFVHEYLKEIWENFEGDMIDYMDSYLAVNCFDTFMQLSIAHPAAAALGGSPNFWFYEGEKLDVTPVIVSEDILLRRGISLGDVAYLSHNMRNLEHFEHKVQVIGAYTGSVEAGMPVPLPRGIVIIPLDVWERLRGTEITYSTVRITVSAARLDELYAFESQIRPTLLQNRLDAIPQIVPMTLRIFDEEFRSAATTLEQNVQLMRIILPIALTITAIIAFGVALLLTLQSAKNAAIMRVLGNSASRVRYTLIMEKAIIAILIVWVGAFAWIFTLMTILGAVAGAIIATNRPPLDLLQIRE